ncbi:MAG: ribose ABC transporter permease, partial [Trueperaceae bacterium]
MLQARDRWRELLARFGLLLALVVMVIVLATISDRFLTTSNIINVLRQISVNAIIAFGMTVVIIGAGIDLSVGSLLALVGVIAAILVTTTGIPVWLVLILAVAIGTALGAINGAFVGYAGVAPFIVTLAGLTIFRGATLVADDGRT